MKAIAFRSKKAKGARLEKRFAQLLREYKLDEQASRMVLSGAAWNFPTDIKTDLPFAFECKNQEKIRLWEFWEQTEKGRKPFKAPVLVVSGNYRPILCVLTAEDFLNLLLENKQLQEQLDSK